MKISAKVEYACLASLALARLAPDDPPLRLREISEQHEIPERYLVQILLQLKAAGLITSTRGALGGYHLARSAEAISLGEVVDAIEGPEQPGRDSSQPTAQTLAGVWKRVHAAERAVLDQISLAKLVAQSMPHEWFI
jgi:Rrf2 family protein